MNFQQFVTTEFGTKLWMALGRLPPAAGHAVAGVVTGILYRRKHASLYNILYHNQAGVLGPDASAAELDGAVRGVLRHAGMTAFDLMHIVAQDEEAVKRAVEFGPEFLGNTMAARATGRGIMIVGIHLSNFNLALLTFALQGFPVQILSTARPTGGFKLMQKLRDRGVVEETPIDPVSLRRAIQRLRQGGVVGTAVDWPLLAPPDELIPFFGRPAQVPTGHIRVAMAANALLLPLMCRWTPERGYYAVTAPPMELELSGDRAADVLHNTRRVLAIAEQWISERPDQWLMYHPVWPETDEMIGRAPE